MQAHARTEMKASLTTVHAKSQPTTTLIKSLSSHDGKPEQISTGYTLSYYSDRPINDRPELDHTDNDKFDYDSPLRQLKKHVTLASFLATNEAVKRLVTSTSSDVPFGYHPETGRAEEYSGIDGVWTPAELAKVKKNRTRNFVNEVTNVDGITCFDLLSSAAKV